MRVLFDGYWWSSGPIANGIVQRELISAWAAEFPEDAVVVALRRGVRVDASGLPAGVTTVRTRLWPHGISNYLELPVLARRSRADVVVAHNYSPARGGGITFIHDAIFEDHPDWFSARERAYFAGMIPSIRSGITVATSTSTEADRLERVTPRGKAAHAVGLAVSTTLATAVPVRPHDLDDISEFALVVGRLNVRKNLQAVIEGAGASAAITRSSPLLVVGSAEFSGRDADLPATLGALVAEGRVRFLGHLDDAELAWLYRHALLAICLSRDEGFGLTPVEAVHFGAPLLVSDIPVFRETVGGYAHFVGLDADAGTVGRAINSAWGARGAEAARLQILDRYSWRASAHRLRALLMS